MKRIDLKPGDRLFGIINAFILMIIACVTIYPFLNILALSFNDATDASRGGIYLLPRKLTMDNYLVVFVNKQLLDAFMVSIARTATGALLSVLFTAMLAYSLSRRELIGRKYFNALFIFTMFVNAGLIPLFMLYKTLHIYNTFFVYILPGLIWAYYMIIIRTYMQQLPKSLEESAFIDGANDLQVFFKIILPVSKPVLATILLFLAVDHWNEWHDTLFFTASPKLETLQYVLMKILQQSEAYNMASRYTGLAKRAIRVTPQSVRMAITIIATVPILCVYPFLQKYFVKGIMLGAIKG